MYKMRIVLPGIIVRVKRLGLPHKRKVAVSPDLCHFICRDFSDGKEKGKSSKYFYILPVQKTWPVVLNRIFLDLSPLGIWQSRKLFLVGVYWGLNSGVLTAEPHP